MSAPLPGREVASDTVLIAVIPRTVARAQPATVRVPSNWIMRPSETTEGQAWLGNFHRADVATATLLIDSLRVLGLSTLQNKLQQLLDEAAETGSIELPAFVVPERNLAHFGIAEPDRATAVAWRDFLPGAPLSVTPGSDGFVGMVLRDYARADRSRKPISDRWIAADADIETLRTARCRSVVILTDFVGTGAQAEAFAGAIARNRTVRSWRSLHLVAVHVAAVAGQQSGVERLRNSRYVDAVHVIESAPTIWTKLPDTHLQDAVVNLCRTYSLKRSRALGYGESGGLLTTERNAPNNLPSVFIQQTRNWKALFADRKVPRRFVEELGDYRPSEHLEALAERIGQLRLGRNERLQSMRQSSRNLLSALTLASDAAVDPLVLAESIGIDVQEADAYLGTLRDWGLVNDSGRITDEGRRELAEHKRGRRRTTAYLQGSSEPYYPLGLR